MFGNALRQRPVSAAALQPSPRRRRNSLALLLFAALAVSPALRADDTPVVSTTYWSSAITGQQSASIPWNDPRFVLSGGACGQASQLAPVSSFGRCTSPWPNNDPTWHIDFTTDSQDFELLNLLSDIDSNIVGGPANSWWRVSVNGVWLQNQYTLDPSQNRGAYTAQFTRLQFATRATRAIHIEADWSYLFGGVVMAPTDSVAAPQFPKRLKAVFVGDSYTIPAGPVPSVGYFSYVGDYFNWDWSDLPTGGTGYLNPGNTGTYTFGARMANIIARNPDVVVVVGGINDNDYAPDALQQAVANFYATLRQNLPNAIIFAAGPQSRGTSENIANVGHAAAIQNGSAPYGVHFIDIIGEQWVSDNVNTSLVISSDGTHLTPYGNQYYAQKLIAHIAPFMAQTAPAVETLSVAPNNPTLTAGANQTVQFSAAATGSSLALPAYLWTISSNASADPNVIGSINPLTGLYTAPASLTTDQTITVKALVQDGSNIAGTVTLALLHNVQPNAPVIPSTTSTTVTPIRIAAGVTNPAGVMDSGLLWSPDSNYNGASAAVADSCAGDTALYQNERHALSGSPLQYTFPLPNGVYNVTLKFADNYFWAPGMRVFNVFLNGAQVENNFDIVKLAGHCTPLDRSYQVVVNNGQNGQNGSLTILLNSLTSAPDAQAKVDAIQITAQ